MSRRFSGGFSHTMTFDEKRGQEQCLKLLPLDHDAILDLGQNFKSL